LALRAHSVPIVARGASIELVRISNTEGVGESGKQDSWNLKLKMGSLQRLTINGFDFLFWKIYPYSNSKDWF
jgi:hypothetical protein